MIANKDIQLADTDVLILGGGLAAAKVCHECGKAGLKTMLAVKERLCSGASFYPFTARLGCLAPRRDIPGDAALFLEEINAASLGMNNEALSRIYIDEIYDRVVEMPEMGIDCHLMENNRIACFAKRERELYYWEDWGKIRHNLRAVLGQFPEVTIMEHWTALELLQKDGQVCGAILSGPDGGCLTVRAQAVVLATGGFGDLFKHNLNTPDVGGDGHVLAYEAGAGLANLEFIQFIPGYMAPKYKVLFGEPCLRFLAGITGAHGQNILAGLLPAGITQQQCFLQRSGHGPFTTSDQSCYFDRAIMQEIIATGREDAVQITFDPRMFDQKDDSNQWYVTWMKEKMKIDMMHDRLSIAPFAHASNGGIVIDEHGWTGVPGLFAAGEVAGTMHGADRIGGCSSGNCLVFGKRAAAAAISWARQANRQPMPKTQIRDQVRRRYEGAGTASSTPRETLVGIRETLWYQASIIRNEEGLRQALRQLDELSGRFSPAFCLRRGDPPDQVAQARNGLELARLIIQAMLGRRESRGAHFRSDYPFIDQERFGQVIIQKK